MTDSEEPTLAVDGIMLRSNAPSDIHFFGDEQGRSFLILTTDGRLVLGPGLSAEEATQAIAKKLKEAYEQTLPPQEPFFSKDLHDHQVRALAAVTRERDDARVALKASRLVADIAEEGLVRWKKEAEAAERESARLTKILQEIAKQKHPVEITPEDRENADWEGGYALCVAQARAAFIKPEAPAEDVVGFQGDDVVVAHDALSAELTRNRP